MQCAACGHENPPKARFCNGCGAALGLVCAACGQQNPADSSFCNRCASPLSAASGSIATPATHPAASGPAPALADAPALSSHQGERRYATILFSDLSGYTAMGERLDPEEVESIMARIKADAVRIVERHGGIVNQFVGDQIVALFGIPVAHADDPMRAVRAALALHDAVRGISHEVEGRVGQRLHMHTGINSGLIVTSLRDDRDGRYGVTGDTVNLGARLAGHAPEGETLVSPEAHRLIAPYFETEPSAPVMLKGKSAPVTPHRVIREVESPQPARRALVGRRSELQQLEAALEGCLEAGRGQTVYVRGDAGIGKTRLVEAFRALAKQRGFVAHTGLVLDFGVGEGRDAVRELMHSLLGLAPGADEPRCRQAARDALSAALVEADQEVFLNDLLDLPQPPPLRSLYEGMDNETRNRRKRETLAHLVRRLAAQQPRLLQVEDVHWADAITLAHLATLAGVAAEAPALLVMTSRIAGDPLAGTWRNAFTQVPVMTIDLAPLQQDEALEMADTFVDVPKPLAARCVERAAGNPLFLEQLLHSAKEMAEEAVPGSVQSTVLARFDRLEGQDKLALQAASVLGQRFSLETLRRLIGDGSYTCRGPLEHHLVQPEGDEFLFSHALIQEGIYSSLLKSRARALHRRAAELFAGNAPALRAEQLDRAEDPGAARAYLEAARTQIAALRHERALVLARRGLALATDPDERSELNACEGQILFDLGIIEQSIAAYERALEHGQDDAHRCRAWIGMAAGMRISDRYTRAMECLKEAETLAVRQSLSPELARVHHLRGNLYFALGDAEGCLEQHQQALVYARAAHSAEMEANALGGLADAHFVRGRAKTAHDHFRRCCDLAREHGFARIEVANMHMLGWTGIFLCAVREAEQTGVEAAERAAKLNQHRAEELACALTAYVMGEYLGNLQGSIAFAEHALRLSRSLGSKRFQARTLCDLARVIWRAGDRARASTLLEESLWLSRETGMRFVGPRILSSLALFTDEPEVRRAALSEAEGILREGCVGHNYLWFYADAIELDLDAGNWEGVERNAIALEAYTRPEPLPWSELVIERGRALTAYGRGSREPALRRNLSELRDRVAGMPWHWMLPRLERALAAW